jgi:hypothetical protein
VRGHDASDYIRSSGAAGNKNHSGPAGGAGVAVGHMRGTLFMTNQNKLDFGWSRDHGIKNRDYRSAGIPEDILDPLRLKTLNERLRTIHDFFFHHFLLNLQPVLKSAQRIHPVFIPSRQTFVFFAKILLGFSYKNHSIIKTDLFLIVFQQKQAGHPAKPENATKYRLPFGFRNVRIPLFYRHRDTKKRGYL